MPEAQVGERIRQRLEEARQRFRGSTGSTSGQLLGAGGMIGGGKLIDMARKRVETMTSRAKTRKPGVVPALTEALERWQPGQRLRELLPQSGGAANLRGDGSSGTGRIYNLRE